MMVIILPKYCLFVNKLCVCVCECVLASFHTVHSGLMLAKKFPWNFCLDSFHSSGIEFEIVPFRCWFFSFSKNSTGKIYRSNEGNEQTDDEKNKSDQVKHHKIRFIEQKQQKEKNEN